ncbi:MAG: hydroxyacid dehydrogenase [Chloroflexi bacterium]|nr:hydroxyacid dehydrogenase [Chloroflexota bacterium]
MKLLVAVPEPLRSQILSPEANAQLLGMGEVLWNEDGRNWSSNELASRLPGIEGLLTGWGIATINTAVLESADKLRIIGHSAGSVKGFITPAVFDRGILVTHAASRIADSVAEFALTMALIGLKRPELYNKQMHDGVRWEQNPSVPLHEIAGMRVGILGCGYVGQRAVRLFKAVGADVWVYDPYLPQARAAALGVTQADLDIILHTSQVISVHLPSTNETGQLLSAERLALIQDGTIFINTARSWVLDESALIAELATGRFWAAIDVFEQEPLPVDHPLRRMANVVLTPHVAGRTVESYRNLLATVVQEIARYQAGQPLLYQVTKEMLTTMA